MAVQCHVVEVGVTVVMVCTYLCQMLQCNYTQFYLSWPSLCIPSIAAVSHVSSSSSYACLLEVLCVDAMHFGEKRWQALPKRADLGHSAWWKNSFAACKRHLDVLKNPRFASWFWQTHWCNAMRFSSEISPPCVSQPWSTDVTIGQACQLILIATCKTHNSSRYD